MSSEQKIHIEYEGIHAQSLAWQDSKLTGFVGTSDLRSNVLVRNGNRSYRNSVEHQGDTLLLKKGALLPTKSVGKQNEMMDITSNGNGSYLISLHDQVIYQRVRDTSKVNDSEQEKFVSLVNKNLRAGLQAVLADEKISMALISGGMDALMSIFPAIALAGFFLAYKGVQANISNGVIPFTEGSFSDTLHDIELGSGLIIGISFSMVTPLEFQRTLLTSDKLQNDVYKNHFDVFEPFHHLLRGAVGTAYLNTKGRTLVKSNS